MKRRRWLAAATRALVASGLAWGCVARVQAQALSNDRFNVQIGGNGEISSLRLTGDAFPTNYVMNRSNAPTQDTADHEWVGELIFSYRINGGAWTSALTNQSSDVRKIAKNGNAVSVSYENSSSPSGVRNFKLVETYSLVDDYLYWEIAVTNTGTQSLEIGDFGLPLPFNEYWFAKDVIYETRTVYQSFTGNNSSYITVSRPSGVGPFLLLVPDATTGAGFEYMDNWRPEEHGASLWAAGAGMPKWSNGLNVFYIHSNAIKSTHRGYLPNTSLMLAAGASKTYAFKFFKVQSQEEVKQKLYDSGLIDVSVAPGMIFATDMTAKIDLHTKKPIQTVTAKYPAETTLTAIAGGAQDHNLYQLNLSHLGQNDLTVSYGDGETTTLQFYAIEPIDAAIQRHATFMVDHTQSHDMNDPLYQIFDDWMMDTKSRRGVVGSWGWGDDWGWTHGQFLAEKNAQTPVASEIRALDDYLNASWGKVIDSRSYVVSDWWCQTPDCAYDRPFAYPHVVNTYLSMFKVAQRYPTLVQYRQPADTYLLRAYHVLNTLYSGRADPGTGYMGEQTLPELMQALRDAGHTSEAQFVGNVISQLYAAFKSKPYPYGSEYSYDNTGEEAVYMAAKVSGDTSVLDKVNTKTRACRGQQPVWYYYADPVTLNGENWWQFQYSVSLVGYCMDDWLRSYSKTPEQDERLSYAAKIANVGAINSGQIDAAPENLGTVAWTYQASKGDVYIGTKADSGTLHNGWRQMSGEADLGLFGALRILSSDVAIDPIFGLFGYGCDVTQHGNCYEIKPKDGVFKRLNLITEHVYLELDRDRYSAATLSNSRDFVSLTLQNQTADAHTTKLTLSGLAPGKYDVSLGAASAGTLTVENGKPASLALSLGSEASYELRIGVGCKAEDPTVKNGSGGANGAGGANGGTGTAPGGSPGGVVGGPSGGAAGDAALTGAGTGGGVATGTPGGKAGGCGCRVAAAASTRTPVAVAGLWLFALARLGWRGTRRRRQSARG
jgi:hypothetical protein